MIVHFTFFFFFLYIERPRPIILHTDLILMSADTSRFVSSVCCRSVITQSVAGTVWVLSSAGNPVHSGNSPDLQNPSPERKSLITNKSLIYSITNDWINYIGYIHWKCFKWSSRFYGAYLTEIMALIEKLYTGVRYFTYRNFTSLSCSYDAILIFIFSFLVSFMALTVGSLSLIDTHILFLRWSWQLE